ncbi:MAG TPA: LysR family transcriptional regulator [Polyangiaceae bacterium]
MESLARVDLNLLAPLDALLREASVTRAAAQLGVTQSAMSRTLARLRALFDDPLLVRRGDAMVPTPLAETLAPDVRAALASIDSLLASRTAFDPATSERRFVVLASDYAQSVILPQLLAALGARAPNMQIAVRASPHPESALLEREASLMLGPARAPTGGLSQRRLFVDRLVCVGRKEHPLLEGELTLERYLGARHVLVAPRGLPGSLVGDRLRGIGRERRVVLEVPHFLAALRVAASSDLLVSVPERLARAESRGLELAIAPLPVATDPLDFVALWHERHQTDPAHAWLRAQIVEAARN